MSDEQRASSVALVLLGERFLSEQAVTLLREEFAQVRAEERRACAAVVDDLRSMYVSTSVRSILHVLTERLGMRS